LKRFIKSLQQRYVHGFSAFLAEISGRNFDVFFFERYAVVNEIKQGLKSHSETFTEAGLFAA
jgi:hypothetical protein